MLDVLRAEPDDAEDRHQPVAVALAVGRPGRHRRPSPRTPLVVGARHVLGEVADARRAEEPGPGRRRSPGDAPHLARGLGDGGRSRPARPGSRRRCPRRGTASRARRPRSRGGPAASASTCVVAVAVDGEGDLVADVVGRQSVGQVGEVARPTARRRRRCGRPPGSPPAWAALSSTTSRTVQASARRVGDAAAGTPTTPSRITAARTPGAKCTATRRTRRAAAWGTTAGGRCGARRRGRPRRGCSSR